MIDEQPIIIDSTGKRRFVCSAVAVSNIIVNQKGEVLLLSSPIKNKDGGWQVISGALEAQETILDGTLREIGEEIGENVHVRPLGPVHVKGVASILRSFRPPLPVDRCGEDTTSRKGPNVWTGLGLSG